jgi:hypothetical protein
MQFRLAKKLCQAEEKIPDKCKKNTKRQNGKSKVKSVPSPLMGEG